ncbi:hypothetical protein GCM10010441_00280 [Kitasatospora paracochleata]|uniref:Uncharacterized protein n=1 Tax=Kitasatospora paracochleata TaxID=58354 RepID=A0ABT1IWT2_9ACTN|nr:hypothetical protein [Kitasatospora paracochleata]MCP2309603.1 hypothetical protein [Kitasatospora paracochleata]
MTHGGDDLDGRMAAEVFRAVLQQPEPEQPPVLAAVRAGGRRLRTRRRLALGAAVLAVVPLLAVTAALVVPGSSGAPTLLGPAGRGAAEERPSTAQPSSYGMNQLDALQSRLRGALAAHLPPGYTGVLNGSGPTTFRLVRADGGYTAVATIMGNPLTPGSRPPSPCEPQGGQKVYASDCAARTLPDGATGWLYRSTSYPGTEFLLATPDGRIAGLGTQPNAAPPQGEGGEPQESKPMTLEEMDALVSAPEVLAALEAVPLDAPG